MEIYPFYSLFGAVNTIGGLSEGSGWGYNNGFHVVCTAIILQLSSHPHRDLPLHVKKKHFC